MFELPMAFNVHGQRFLREPLVAIMKTKSATIAFFSSPPFLLLTLSLSLSLSLSPFLFLRYCDFGPSRASETCLLTPFYSKIR